jgi:hypothetical protein
MPTDQRTELLNVPTPELSAVDLILARKRAEAAVADMAEGGLKEKAFEVILTSLLVDNGRARFARQIIPPEPDAPHTPPSSLAARIALVAEEGFFAEPKSLSEIQEKLVEHGWHYPQTNLSTPLVRLVRQRRLRRLQVAEANKRIWKYTLP